MSKSRTKSTIINAISCIMLRLLSIILSFGSRSFFIKTLGSEYAGVSGLFTDILVILSFVELGIGTAITYKLYKPIANNDKLQITVLMNFYKKAYRLISVTVLVLGIVLLPFIDFFIKEAPDIKESLILIYLLYVFNTASSYLFIYKSTLLYANQEQYIAVKWQGILYIIQTTLQVICLILFKDFIVYLVIQILFTLLQNIMISYVVDKRFPYINEKTSESLSKNEIKSIFKDVKALFLYKFSGVVLNGTDSLIASRMIGISAVGIFSNYKLVGNHVNSIASQLFSSATASIGNLAASEDSEKQYEVFKKILFLCFWCYCLCSTCLFSLFNVFIEDIWLDKSYTFSIEFVAVFVAEFFIKGMQTPIASFRTSNGLFVNGQYRPLFMALINIVISIILVYYIGITGVLLGTVISRIVTQVWYDPWLLYNKVFKKRFSSFLVQFALYCVVTAFGCILSLKLGEVCNIDNVYINFLVRMLIAVVIPNLLVFLLYRKTQEFKYVLNLLNIFLLKIKSRKRVNG